MSYYSIKSKQEVINDKYIPQVNKLAEHQPKYRTFIVPLCLATVLLIILVVFKSESPINGQQATTKTYVAYTVEPEDTLWQYAERFRNKDYYSIDAYIDEVIAINQLNGETIYAGDRLILPQINPR